MESRDKSRFDEWLDKALHEYGEAEPRAGLERRVLATLAANKTVRGWNWKLAFAGSCAVAAVVALVLVVSFRPGPEHVPAKQASNSGFGVPQPRTENPTKISAPQVVRASAAKLRGKRPHAVVTAASEPRLDHFPSPRPLTLQEVVVASYAERFPQDAAVIAQEQQKFDDETAKAQQETGIRSALSNENE